MTTWNIFNWQTILSQVPHNFTIYSEIPKPKEDPEQEYL